jgi:hypothetical protein
MKTRWSLTLSFLAAGLFLLAFMFIAVLGGSRIGFLYGRQPGFSTFRSVVQWTGLIAALGFFVAGIIVSVAVAIRPASWLHKIFAVLPVLLLLFAAAGAVSAALGIGAIGNLAVVPLLGPVTFASGWLALGGVLAVVAVVLAVAIGQYSARTVRAATLTMGVTSLASAIAAVAMIGAVIVVANNQPSLPNFRGGEGAATTFVSLKAAGSQPAARAPQAGPTPGARQGGQRQGGGEGGGEGRFPEGGFQGGPGGGLAAARQQFIVAGVLMVILAIVQVFSTLVALAGGPAGAAAAAAPVAAEGASAGHGVGGAILAAVGIALVVFGLIQLVPVQRTNPPVQTTVNWDSQQTQQLWQRACADCHSNQTQWPWYTTIAPGSWLTAAHVNAGRERFNISQVAGGSGFRREGGAGESVQQIRSGQMPLADYLLIHPNANLTAAEKQELMQGLQKTFGG